MIFMKYLSDIDFKVFINLYKKWTEKLYSFLIIDTIFASVNPLSFTIDDKIRDDHFQNEINI